MEYHQYAADIQLHISCYSWLPKQHCPRVVSVPEGYKYSGGEELALTQA